MPGILEGVVPFDHLAQKYGRGDELMETEALNDYFFTDLVTQWAGRIALSRASRSSTTSSSDVELSVTNDDLKAALAQLEFRRNVIRALRDAATAARR